ncbi:MAG: 50S ribosomal protein L18 [Nitrososphaeraceae archaeon]
MQGEYIMGYIATLKRIRNGRTNYRKRAALLLSRRRFVTITVSDENVQAQIAYPMAKGDVTITSSHSRELARFGWNGSLNSLPACYLTGLLLGKKSLRKDVDEAVLYTGKNSFTSRVAACLKGVIDSGMKVPASDSSFPPEERLVGNHIAEYARILRDENKDVYNSHFSRLISNNFDPTQYSSYVQKVMDAITASNELNKVTGEEK